MVQIEHRLPIDAIRFQRAAPTLEIPHDGRVGNDHVVGKPCTKGKRKATGALYTVGVRRVVEKNTSWAQVPPDQVAEVLRQVVGDLSPEISGRVGHDGVAAAVDVKPQPAPTVVD